MSWVALRMLVGDRAKYFGIVFGVAFASLLISHQISIFVGIMGRTTSQIRDVQEADIWVVDPKVRYSEELYALSESDLHRVRGVPGVAWAVKFYKGNVRARMSDGNFRSVVMMGIDDATLIGAPREMVVGTLADLRQPDAVIVDQAGYEYLWPGQPVELGKRLEMNDRRAVLVGVCKASSPFQSMPILYTRYSQATLFAPPERRVLTCLLVGAEPDVPHADVCKAITEKTGLQAVTRDEFAWKTIGFYLSSTGIPVNFGITVLLGFVVGVAIAGQTFYLFTIENLKQFGALKAMGTGNLRIVGMILLQACVVGLLGYGIGIGFAALFFQSTQNVTALAGFALPWQVMAGTAVAVLVIVVLASLLSIRKVLVLEPAVVFR
jgi:putative ABC transport system permease protein